MDSYYFVLACSWCRLDYMWTSRDWFISLSEDRERKIQQVEFIRQLYHPGRENLDGGGEIRQTRRCPCAIGKLTESVCCPLSQNLYVFDKRIESVGFPLFEIEIILVHNELIETVSCLLSQLS